MNEAETRTYRPGTGTAVFWVIAAVISWIVSFLLYREYIGQITGEAPSFSCDFSPFITCGPNLLSPAGNLLGFTNAILGMTLFFGPIYAGIGALAAPGGMRAWYWRIFVIAVLGGFALVHFLAYRSVFEFGSLCPWCMVVWLMTIPLFWSVTGWTLEAGVWGEAPRRLGAIVVRWTLFIVVVNYLLIVIAAQWRLDLLSLLWR